MSGLIRSGMPTRRPLRRRARAIRFVLVVAVAVTAIAFADALASDLILAGVAALAIVGVAGVSFPR